MTESNQPEEANTNYRLRSMVGAKLPDEATYPLSEDEFLNLCEGSTSDSKSGMFLCIGLLVSAIVGFFSLFENTDWNKFWTEQKIMPLVYFAVLFFIGAGAFVGLVSCGLIMLKKNMKGTSHSRTKKRITTHFATPRNAVSETPTTPAPQPPTK